MRLLAPAKINLHLRVGPPRADGFHPLLSWMCTVKLFDKLVVERAAGRVVRLTCDWPGLPTDQENLVVKAALAMAEAIQAGQSGAGALEFGLSVSLEKRIPPGAGLGGGSSDAARALLGLNNLWAAGWSRAKLAAFASVLGSDVPFFFHGPSAVCRGRGELVKPLSPPQPRFALLILPGLHLATANVYRRFDQMRLGNPAALEDEPDWTQWSTLSALNLLPRLVNDLELAAFNLVPQLGELRQAAEKAINRPVRMSGSGSSLFALFDQEQEAQEAAGRVSQDLGVKAVAVETAPRLEDDLNDPPQDR